MSSRHSNLRCIEDADCRLYRVQDDLAGVVPTLGDKLSGDEGDELCGREVRHNDYPFLNSVRVSVEPFS